MIEDFFLGFFESSIPQAASLPNLGYPEFPPQSPATRSDAWFNGFLFLALERLASALIEN